MKQGCALACLQNRKEASLAFHHTVNDGQRSRKVRVRVLVMRRSEKLWQDVCILFYMGYKAIGGF